ncbi:MAG: hypothetical protein IJK39_03785 [Bacteroidales bacterium]|nr:hypothetical protein [Bacteroidales bacterium]
MKNIMLFAASALLLLSCSKTNSLDGVKRDGEKTIFHATVEGIPSSGTKIYSDRDLKVLWNADDRISIFNKRTYNDQYKFLGQDGDSGGDFKLIPPEGFISGNDIDHIFAVYPYVKGSNKINNSGTLLTITLPNVQTYKENSVGVGANYMVAAADDMYLQFKNVGGYLRFRFWGNNVSVSSITLEGNNGEKLAGKADVTMEVGGLPSTAMQSTATGSITLSCETPVALGSSADNATEFIFVVPPTTFTGGFKVTVTDNQGKTFTKSSTKSLTITRSKMESMGAMQVTPN